MRRNALLSVLNLLPWKRRGDASVPSPAWTMDEPAGSGLPSTWEPQIAEIVRTLRALNAGTEQGFLAVGSHLRDIHRHTVGVSQRLTALVDELSNEGKGETIEGLRRIMETSTRYLAGFDATANSAVAHLATVTGIVRDLPEMLGEFGRVVARLRIMGMTTRIETARLGLLDLGFEHLADAVTVLGEQIAAKAKDVQTSLRTIVNDVSSNEEKLVALRDGHRGMRAFVDRDMHANIDRIGEKHEALVRVVGDIARQSVDARSSIDTVVSAVQFHDITRQQIEHVVEALEDLQRELATGNPEARTHAILVCELQPAQLRRAREEFDGAIQAMIGSFGHLDGAVNAMHVESRDVVAGADVSGGTYLDEIERHLGDVVGALAEGERAIHELIEALGRIAQVVQGMKTYMEEMGEVGTEIELLALNSRVRAAKALGKGAALGVIAEAIQHLSTEARTHIGEVVAGIGTLVEVTQTMQRETLAGDLSTETETGIGQMGGQLRDLIRVFHASNLAGADALRDTEAACHGLSVELSSLAEMLHAQSRVSSTLASAEQALLNIAGEARVGVSAAVLGDVEHRLDELRSRYTMHIERDTHDAFLGGREAGSPSADAPQEAATSTIELF